MHPGYFIRYYPEGILLPSQKLFIVQKPVIIEAKTIPLMLLLSTYYGNIMVLRSKPYRLIAINPEVEKRKEVPRWIQLR
jgi:hypothetical protein